MKDLCFLKEEKIQRMLSRIRSYAMQRCTCDKLREKVKAYVLRVCPSAGIYVEHFCDYATSFRDLCFYESCIRICGEF